MRILLDECVDRRLAASFTGHEVKNVVECGWAGTKNGELLRRTEAMFDVFVTVDRNLSFQQAIWKTDLRILVLCAPTNRLADLLPLIPSALAALDHCAPGHVVQVSRP
ncbi:MAG: DUF5615 family PIN-like protein [Acidobacteriales bacterium]|nr:DUF5615 family PIN-like protein [Terriglobales bacterium]